MPRKSRAAMSTIQTTADKLKQQLKTVLARDIANLLTASYMGKLNLNESNSLVSYYKLINDMQKDEQAEMEKLTDEELEKISDT